MSAQDDAAKLWRRVLPKLVARAWSDAGFRQRLESSPQEVFKEYGLPLIPDIGYEVKEGPVFSVIQTLTIPPRPPDLKEESVEDVMIEVFEKAHVPPRSICTF